MGPPPTGAAIRASLLDAHTCRRAAPLDAGDDAHHAALSAAAFAPSRRFLATAGANAGGVTLWDPATGAPRALLHLDAGKDAEARNAGAAAATAGSADSASATATAAARRGRGRLSASVSSAGFGLRDFSAEGHFADAGDPWVTCIRLHDPGPDACATSYGVAPDAAAAAGAAEIVPGSLLLAAGGSASGRVVLWAVAPDGGSAVRTGELAAPEGGADVRGGGGVAVLEFAAHGRSLLVVQSCSTAIRVWSVASRSVTATLRLPAASGEIFALRFAPHAERLPVPNFVPKPPAPDAGANAKGGKGGKGGKAGASVTFQGTPPTAASGEGAAAGSPVTAGMKRSGNITAAIVAATTQKLKASGTIKPSTTSKPKPPTANDGNANEDNGPGNVLFAAVCTKTTQLWSLDKRRQVASMPFGAGEEGGRTWAESCVAFSPAGGLLATAGALLLARPTSSPTEAASGEPAAATTSADANAGGGGGGGGAGGSAAAAPSPPTPPDSTAAAVLEAAAVQAALAGDYDRCAATLWDARTGARVAQLRGTPGPVRALAFSPDGGLLAAAAGSAVMLWSAAGGACLAVLPLGSEVTDSPAVAFGRGGATLLAAGLRTVHSWDVTLVAAAAAADTAGAAGSVPVSRGTGGGGGSLTGMLPAAAAPGAAASTPRAATAAPPRRRPWRRRPWRQRVTLAATRTV
ncbi:hypothetical protein GPECTOR_12g450 [Gonium pectorale]|uniref:Uncharacterized protein n=1 Tax=Gonium pectorale TaxID=33097 RepID=A0A150GNU0_GONPE|nr:hypothetical protein GPECTOR_12g450 [Gonium pectorale]|eukprot:KXZ51487.1 hypothetical protein GPECTOR_12g450 [Gonium pectorale]